MPTARTTRLACTDAVNESAILAVPVDRVPTAQQFHTDPIAVVPPTSLETRWFLASPYQSRAADVTPIVLSARSVSSLNVFLVADPTATVRLTRHASTASAKTHVRSEAFVALTLSAMLRTTKPSAPVFQHTQEMHSGNARELNMNVKLTVIVEGIMYVSITNAKISMNACKAEVLVLWVPSATIYPEATSAAVLLVWMVIHIGKDVAKCQRCAGVMKIVNQLRVATD